MEIKITEDVRDKVCYRKAELTDIEQLTKLRIKILRAANCLDEQVEMPEVEINSKEYYARAMEIGEHTVYLAYVGKILVGAGGISYYQVLPTYHNPSGQKAYIMNMYTDPEFRRKGIATHMLDLLVQDAKAKNVTDIFLEATKMGRPLYERYGFTDAKCEMKL